MGDSSAEREDEHPADRRIRELAAGDAIQPGDRQLILDCLAAAQFSHQLMLARADVRGVVYLGRKVQRRDDTSFMHLVRRVVVREQWADGTTLDEYLADLHSTVRHSDVQVAIYDRGQGPVVLAIGPNMIPPRRQGRFLPPYMAVIYAPDRSSIITGYPIIDLSDVDIPEDAIWLP